MLIYEKIGNVNNEKEIVPFDTADNKSEHQQILALCGDIGSPYAKNTLDFIRYCSDGPWDKILWVPGLEECGPSENQGHKWIDHISEMRKLEYLFPRLKIMSRNLYEINDNVRIIGTSLFGPANLSNTQLMHLNWFKRFHFFDNTINKSPSEFRQHMSKLHECEVEWINIVGLSWLTDGASDYNTEYDVEYNIKSYQVNIPRVVPINIYNKNKQCIILTYNCPTLSSLCIDDSDRVDKLAMCNNRHDAELFTFNNNNSVWIFGDSSQGVSGYAHNRDMFTKSDYICANPYNMTSYISNMKIHIHAYKKEADRQILQ